MTSCWRVTGGTRTSIESSSARRAVPKLHSRRTAAALLSDMTKQTITNVTPPAQLPVSRHLLTTANVHHDALLRRIRGEFREMPGLALSLYQAQRMWNLHRNECERLLDDLVGTGFLTCSPLGVFMLADSGRAGA